MAVNGGVCHCLPPVDLVLIASPGAANMCRPPLFPFSLLKGRRWRVHIAV
ncbi:hypothetical protein Ga0080574_TMP1267 [Salipiger abyssi]|uniref:Uncharacterized protein n=1 Tax=Salipiger abyssi TaxID=1250539 RepID=A0A1P8UQE4_9RHOB|nr:hypothetical protein Ga0080574_TMP1267 [Salipiger abyssi]